MVLNTTKSFNNLELNMSNKSVVNLDQHPEIASQPITAFAEQVVLVSFVENVGEEMVSEGGLYLGERTQGQIPEVCTVFSVGSEVPPGLIARGDLVPIPLGNIRNVPHPDVAYGLKSDKELKEKFVTVHWKNIPCIYK